jgi:hypothetical protein
MGQVTGDPNKATSGPVADHNIDPDDVPAKPAATRPAAPAQTAPANGSGRAEDILAMIRNRQKS